MPYFLEVCLKNVQTTSRNIRLDWKGFESDWVSALIKWKAHTICGSVNICRNALLSQVKSARTDSNLAFQLIFYEDHKLKYRNG